MKYIEFFSGCGGLSLGLQAVGFENIMVNELSPMAGETYAYNFYNEDLSQPNFLEKKNPHTVWLSSKYSVNDMTLRLREDPREYPDLESTDSFSDVSTLDSIRHKLIIGSIKELNQVLKASPSMLKSINDADVVSGGPPCQSFSMAGLRDLSNDRNTLPWEFMQFVELTNPKIAVLENVSGILRAFRSEGKPYYAWFEIAKGFAALGYVPICLHVNARFTGIAQNRNRFILIAIRFDTLSQQLHSFNDIELSLIKPYISFYQNIESSKTVKFDDIKVIDLTKGTDTNLVNTFLAPFFEYKENNFTVKDVIDDLKASDNLYGKKSKYLEFIESSLKTSPIISKDYLQNHDLRANSLPVKRRFRIYQVLNNLESSEKKEALDFLKGRSEILSEKVVNKLLEFNFLLLDGSFGKLSNENEITMFFRQHLTKKHSQKALIPEMPAPSALSIPDDVCHYDESELRTLTVREMARIQSFPDSFVFKSKVTTGGKMRKFEVPQYTQVGNAVPPILGVAIGKVVKNILS